MTDLLIREEAESRTRRRRKRTVRRFLARVLVAFVVASLAGGAVYLAGPGANPKQAPPAEATDEPVTQQAVVVAMTLKGDASQQADSLTIFGAGGGAPVGFFIPTGTLATIPGQGRVPLQNVYAVAPGRSNETLVVMAHRDKSGEA